MAKKCADGYYCFEQMHVILLLVASLIVCLYIWKNYYRLWRILKDVTVKKVVPINVPTRGPAPQYERIGTLHEVNSPNENRGKILPLFGRQTYSGSSKWMYYTMTDQQNMVHLPVHNARRKNCMGEMGCEELYTDDIININAYSGDFNVKLYVPQHPRYIPV